MLYSKLFGKTIHRSRTYDSTNATLLIKAGFIDQVMAGVYTLLPLGLRTLNKIEQIIREEMDKIGQEILMPAMVPTKLWEDTGRREKIDILFKVMGANELSQKKNDAEYILNPTHEEVVTPLAKKFSFSYRDLPFALYQIQTKFRNEARAKSGLLRLREFRMKDLYSFHRSQEELMNYYHKEAIPTYRRVFDRLGIGQDTVIALASGGSFTDDYSHEFQTICPTGEDQLFYVKSTATYYNREVAPSKAPPVAANGEEMFPKQDIYGEGIIGVEELAHFLKIPVEKTTKTILFETDNNQVIMAAVRGGYEINEEKLRKVVGARELHLASPDTVKKITGAEIGYAGLLNLPKTVRIVMDESLQGRTNFETGANRTGYHTINVNFGRDLPEPEHYYDIKIAKEGDYYPPTGELYKVVRASEVGNIFPLNTKFSEALNYTYTDENGKQQLVYMGCYGIGPSRIIGVLAEKFHDDKGLIWPKVVAPYTIHLVGLDLAIPTVKKNVYSLYESLRQEGIEVLYDDREDVGAGKKLTDADLIGIPIRLVVSKRTCEDKIEFKQRADSKTFYKSLPEIIKSAKFESY